MYTDAAYMRQKNRADRFERELGEMESNLRAAKDYAEWLAGQVQKLEERCELLHNEGVSLGVELAQFRMSYPRPTRVSNSFAAEKRA